MADPSLELQGAITERLKATAGVTGIVGQRIFDRIPRNQNGDVTAQFPYVSFGGDDLVSDDADCITGFEITVQIDAWSRAVGFQEAKRIANEVRLSLHRHEFELTDNAAVLFEHRITRVFRDPDGITSHAAMTFTAYIEQP